MTSIEQLPIESFSDAAAANSNHDALKAVKDTLKLIRKQGGVAGGYSSGPPAQMSSRVGGANILVSRDEKQQDLMSRRK